MVFFIFLFPVIHSQRGSGERADRGRHDEQDVREHAVEDAVAEWAEQWIVEVVDTPQDEGPGEEPGLSRGDPVAAPPD